MFCKPFLWNQLAQEENNIIYNRESLYYDFEPNSLYDANAIRAERKVRQITSTARGSDVARALLPSVSSISRTPRLSQIYTITPLSNLIDSIC